MEYATAIDRLRRHGWSATHPPAPAETIAETSAPSEAPKPEENQEPESTVMSMEETAPEPELEYTLPIHDDSISISYWISWES